MPNSPLVIYVDVDDTLVRSIGDKRIPVPHVVQHVRELSALGHELWCWSSGGAQYARQVAEELKIDACIIGILPKPKMMIDDQSPGEWRYLTVVHPNEVG